MLQSKSSGGQRSGLNLRLAISCGLANHGSHCRAGRSIDPMTFSGGGSATKPTPRMPSSAVAIWLCLAALLPSSRLAVDVGGAKL